MNTLIDIATQWHC